MAVTRMTKSLFGWGLAGLAPAVAIGVWPTWRLAGWEGLTAMAVGSGIALVGSLIGSVIAARLMAARPELAGFYAMGAAAVRSVLVLAASVAVVLATTMSPVAVLVWASIGYLAALAGETVGLVRMLRRMQGELAEAAAAV